MLLNSAKGSLLAEINVTPFVDVMLVLLIIFMVAAPMMTQGLDVDLPKTRTVQTLPEDSDHLVLTVRRDGSIFIDEYAVSLDDLNAQLTRLFQNKNRLLYLQADKDVPYGVVVRVMAEVKEAGIERLGVVAEQEDLKKK